MLLLPRLLYCPDQMLFVIVLTQHQILSSKILNLVLHIVPNVWNTIIRTWSAVCLGELHSQCSEQARPRLCMDESNCPTPVRRQFRLTQAVRVKLNPIGMALAMNIKARSLDVILQYSVFHL